MRMTANQAGRPLPRMVAACLLAAAAIPAAACTAADRGTDTAFRDTVLRHEQLIADCMKERGFDYVVGVPKSVLAEEARRQAKAAGEDAQAAMEQTLADVTDPNERLVAALSPKRQAQWGDALWGDSTRIGCHDLTYEAAWGVSPGDLAAEGEAFLAKVEADPGVAAARGAYGHCMAAQGHTLDHPNELETMIGRNAEDLEEKAAEAYAAAVLDDHEACVGPYNQVLAETYDRLSQ